MKVFIILILAFYNFTLYAQNYLPKIDSLKSEKIDPLRPAKAAFYSAILPGLGQGYNKKYWKIPIVYGSIGTSMYFYIDNNEKYNLYRDEYKKRLEGIESDSDFLAGLSRDQLISAQKEYKRYRDISALFSIGFYALNIIDANIDASISQFNVDESLVFRPNMNIDNVTLKKTNFGISCVYLF
ncbi:DUF5683 domain-containing protein [Flavobacterium sp. MDT1-60]|uniref:DUF5683 domain-containing protein n=1 Tax=Flavobacterium sp. MDT1-60 TaxID=1979344 RepID=UPI001780029C|nr:DUF5683 domain-containing protein [Flavobacterium sp. MDT1-60]QOG03659.1 hypothetical protein IHE43_05355 [Flavobacterium sp. MDT1-60]